MSIVEGAFWATSTRELLPLGRGSFFKANLSYLLSEMLLHCLRNILSAKEDLAWGTCNCKEQWKA
eukprot:4845154-Amphidinium_carterae.1